MLVHLAAALALTSAPVLHVSSSAVPPRQDAFERGIARMADNLSGSLNGRVVAVLEFPSLENRMTSLGRLVSEQLTTDLVQRLGTQARVVERRQVVQVQKELEFLETELSPAQIDSLGRALGADAIVIGSASAVGEQIMVNIRAVGIPGWQVLGADRMSVRGNRELLRLASIELLPIASNGGAAPSAAPVSPSPPPAPLPSPPPPPSPPAPPQRQSTTVVTTGSLRVELSGCSLTGTTLTCELIFSPQDDGVLALLALNYATGNRSRVIGQDGQEHEADATRLGSPEYGQEGLEAVAGVPVRGAVRFRDVSRTAMIPVLELQIRVADEFKAIRFRDVAVR